MKIGIDSTKLRARGSRAISRFHKTPLPIGIDLGTQGIRMLQFQTEPDESLAVVFENRQIPKTADGDENRHLDTIAIVKDVTKNVYYDRLWRQVNENLGHGEQLSDTLFKSTLFPESVAQMIYSGEQAGRLGDVFGRVANFAEDEFDQAVKNATQFIEPVMIVVMGSMIGFIAISLLLPIFSAGKVISGN